MFQLFFTLGLNQTRKWSQFTLDFLTLTRIFSNILSNYVTGGRVETCQRANTWKKEDRHEETLMKLTFKTERPTKCGENVLKGVPMLPQTCVVYMLGAVNDCLLYNLF